jgi:hypothetical protein
MKPTTFEEAADRCRQMALEYLSRPEAPFLLRVAREFDRLQRTSRSAVNARPSSDQSDEIQPGFLAASALGSSEGHTST